MFLIAVHTLENPMATVRRRHRSDWLEFLPYWLIVAIVVFEIGNALWLINRIPDPAEVHELPAVQVHGSTLPEISVHLSRPGKPS
jgi:hypothetical protein